MGAGGERRRINRNNSHFLNNEPRVREKKKSLGVHCNEMRGPMEIVRPLNASPVGLLTFTEGRRRRGQKARLGGADEEGSRVRERGVGNSLDLVGD